MIQISRSALEILEIEIRESSVPESQGPTSDDLVVSIQIFSLKFGLHTADVILTSKIVMDLGSYCISLMSSMLQVRMDHMAAALSKTFKSPVVETIQSLPQHQQVSYIVQSFSKLQQCLKNFYDYARMILKNLT